MTKRTFCRGFAAVLAWLLASLPVFASSPTAYDLSSLGIQSFAARSVSTQPTADGVMRDGEYPANTTVSFGKGLFLTAPETGADLTDQADNALSISAAGTKMTCGVAFDRSTAYLALHVSSPAALFGETYQAGIGGALAVSFSVGLSQSSSLTDYTSAWDGAYFFRQNDCVGASGKVIRYEGGAGSMEHSYRSWSNKTENAYRDDSGYLWDGSGYVGRAGAKFNRSDSGDVLTVECAVPIEELLLSVPAAQRDTVRSDLQSGKGTVHGCFSAGVVLPQSSPAEGRLVLSTAKGVSGSSLSAPLVLPSPLYWRGSPPAVASTAPNAAAGNAATDSVPDDQSDDVGGSVVVITDSDAALTETAEITETQAEEWTATVQFPEEGGEMEEHEEPGSQVSPWIAVASGAMLLLTALILLLVIRRMDRRDQMRREEEARKVEQQKEERKAKSPRAVVGRRKRR